MIIILDFDDVLFNTLRFKKELAIIFQRYKLDFQKIYNTIKSNKNIFSLEKCLNLAQKENKNIDIKKLNKSIDRLFENLNQFLYSDTLDFLNSVQDYNLILLSWGEEKFQKRKIYGLGKEFTSFFNKIITGPLEKNKVLDKILKSCKDKSIVFIDDKISELEKIRTRFKNVILIQLKRSANRLSTEKKYIKVTNLSEVEKIIKKNVPGTTTPNSPISIGPKNTGKQKINNIN